jgi:hypothetical protein
VVKVVILSVAAVYAAVVSLVFIVSSLIFLIVDTLRRRWPFLGLIGGAVALLRLVIVVLVFVVLVVFVTGLLSLA